MQGAPVKKFEGATKRYVQLLNLKDNPELLAAYRHQHSPEGAWPEIIAGIREVGILEMELYLEGNHAVMIVEAPADFDWDTAMARLATLPRQQEWEDANARFQDCKPGQTSDEKWRATERIFHLYE